MKKKRGIKKEIGEIEEGAEMIAKKIFARVRIILGVFLVIFGIASLFLPIFPGILIIILGFIFLGKSPLKKLMLGFIKKFMKSL